MVNEKINAKEIAIYSPYKPEWIKRARDLGGEFDGEKKCWFFPASRAEAVRAGVRAVYGVLPGREGEERVTVSLTALREVSVRCEPIFYQGVLIAEARGRDSGAKIGPDCALLQGKATSGGSSANWRTIISAGSVIEVVGIPRSHVTSDRDWSAEIVGAAEVEIDRDALTAERDALKARIAEIDAALAGPVAAE